MFKLIFHPHVLREIKASYSWYQDKAVGLGDDFINEPGSAYETIREYPRGWPVLRLNFRRFVLQRFPFSVIYRVNSDTIYIVAVMHNHRKPDYWLSRK